MREETYEAKTVRRGGATCTGCPPKHQQVTRPRPAVRLVADLAGAPELLGDVTPHIHAGLVQ